MLSVRLVWLLLCLDSIFECVKWVGWPLRKAIRFALIPFSSDVKLDENGGLKKRSFALIPFSSDVKSQLSAPVEKCRFALIPFSSDVKYMRLSM